MKALINLFTLIIISSNQLIAQNINVDIDQKLWKQANKIAKRSIFIDCHSHSLFSYNAAQDVNTQQITYPLLVKGNVKGLIQGFPTFESKTGSLSEKIISDIKIVKSKIERKEINASIVLKSADFYKYQKKKEIACMFLIENFEGICEGEVSKIEQYYKEGVRQIGFYNKKLDSLYNQKGLTQQGIQYINEMNRLGIIIDITHVLESVRGYVIESSKAPLLISHANSMHLVNSGNNVSDSVLVKLAKRGGMICVSFNSGRLSNKVLEQMRNEKDQAKWSRASIDDLMDHLDYLKSLIGIENIGIGSDYGGTGRFSPEGLEKIDGFPLIIYHMLKRGYSEKEIEKVMGLNFIRFFERVESKSLNSSIN